MSGWLGCCECLQRRAMAPARRHGAALPAAPPPHQHGHHNAAFLGDEEVTTPPPPPPDQQPQQQPQEPGGVTAESASEPPSPSPTAERYRVVPQLVRPQFREICDLRDQRPGLVRRSTKQTRPGRSPNGSRSPHGPAAWLGFGSSEDRPPAAASSGPFLPNHRDIDTEWPTEELVVLDPQRRVSLLDNIPETSETNVTGEGATTEGEKRPDGGPGGACERSKSVPPGHSVKWEDDVVPAGSPGADRTESPSASPQRPARTRAASLGTPRRLTFARFRRRSSQRRQSSDSGGASTGREQSRERSWLRRLSRGRPSTALRADQPPEQPSESAAQTASANRSQAARHWDLVRTNFDLDAPLTEHWGFLESVVTEFEKVDAKTYTEHLHEQSPLSSSSSEEEVPDALEAQLLLKLAQAEKIRPRKVSVSRRCVQNERRRRRSEQMASSGEEPASGAEHGEECQKEGNKDQERAVVSEDFPVPPKAETEEKVSVPPVTEASEDPVKPCSERAAKPSAEEPRVPPLISEVDPSADRQSSPTQRASSCPPPRVEPPAPPAADRRRRGSLLSRLLGLPTGQSRRPSLPAPVKPPPAAAPPPSEEDHEVHHPTWFERTAGPEAAAGPTADRRALSRRRATVAEVSLKEFLHEVDERAQHLRDEEFCGADPYEVLAPEQKAADDDHVVPLLNTSRCVKLMLEDAERRLEREYGTGGSRSPSPRPSQCPTPRRCAGEGSGGTREGQQAGTSSSPPDRTGSTAAGTSAVGGGAGSPDRQPSTSRAGSPDKQIASTSGAGCPDKSPTTSRSTSPDKQVGAAISSLENEDSEAHCANEAEETTDGAGPLEERATVSPEGGPAECPSLSPRSTPPPEDRRGRRDTTSEVTGSQRRAQSVPPPGTKLGRLPAYLTNIQHEMATVAETLRAKLQATLSSSHDSEPSTSRERSPPKSARIRRTSRSSSMSSDAARPAAELDRLAARPVPSATPTPRNAIAQPTEEPSPVDSAPESSPELTPTSTVALPPTPAPNMALVGYQQMALALARHSTVGYRDLAIALARREPSPSQCQGVQTSPRSASPADCRPGPSAGQSRSAQTSPGVSTPAETALGCGQCPECTGRVPTGQQSGTPGGTSATQCAPTCPRKGSCTQGAPSKANGVPITNGTPSITNGAPPASQCAPECQQSASCSQGTPCSGCAVCPHSSPAPASDPAPESPPRASPPSGGAVWTVAVWEPPVLAAPPARLLAYGQPSWVARQQSSGEAAELRRRLDSGQRAAGRRRDSLLRRRAERAAQMAGQSGRHGGDHERADAPRRPFWR
ncbi:SH3 domain-containing protein C23A1.17-like [Amphibalanus amphitrite]|uniref:SH3 domain-containing protein C23A1.17-like n=1 Tax=Amphibalanus amphitrite TaxID=1232801 RepID=UPI001C9234CC|nr:SH3 domain-containing protein C23A1.17-like [Amphibalanus amphitrite]